MIENYNPFQALPSEPERTPLGLQKGENKFQPLPTGGFMSNNINGHYVGIDPTRKFDTNAWSLRKKDEDTWSEIRALELAAGAPQGAYNAWENFITWAVNSDKPVFNDTAKGASVKAMYLNTSPMHAFEYGDSQLTPEAIKEAHEKLGLLLANEPPDAVFDPANITDNQKQLQETMKFLGYAYARQRAEENRNYSFNDYYAGTVKDTYGLFGTTGPWGWVAEGLGEYYGSGKPMPKDISDTVAMLNRDDPNFDYEKFWNEKTQDPIVREGLLDSGLSVDLIRMSKNEDMANYILNESLVNSDIQRRIAAYNAQHNFLVRSSVSVANFGAGMLGSPDIVPFTLATAASRGAVIGLRTAVGAAAKLLPLTFVARVAPAARVAGTVAEGIATIPFGMHPTYIGNLNVLTRLGASAAGMASISTMHDIATQNKEIALAAALDYQDPNAKTEYDIYQTFVAAGHGALTGLTLFGIGAGVEGLVSIPMNMKYGPEITTMVEGRLTRTGIRDPFRSYSEVGFTAKDSLANTTIGELVDTFGTIRNKFGTLIGRPPAEAAQIKGLLEDRDVTPQDVVRETTDATSRAEVRSNDSVAAVEANQVDKPLIRQDAETKSNYAQRVGALRLIDKPFDFFAELGRQTNADGQTLGKAPFLFRMTAQAAANLFREAEQYIREAREAETAASGGTLPPERAAVYAKLEATRAKWLRNSINRMTSVERNAFLAETRTGTAAEKVAIARNNAINSAERNANAESLAASLLENARNDEKPVGVPPEVQAATDAAALEHKVTGEISEQTAQNVKAAVLGKKPKTVPKITKIIQRAVRNSKMNPKLKENIRKVAKNSAAFLELAKGNRDNAGRYFKAINDLVDAGLMTHEQRTLMLSTALQFDFDSEAFNLTYRFEATAPSDKSNAAAYYDSAAKEIVFVTSVMKDGLITDPRYSTIVFLHELGHSMFQHTVGTKKYLNLLKGYLNLTDADALSEAFDSYALSNMEETYVTAYSELVFAKNQALVAEALTPMQQTVIKSIFDTIKQNIIEVALGLNESSYYTAISHVIEDMAKAEAVLTKSIGNITDDVKILMDDLTASRLSQQSIPTEYVGNSSGVRFNKAEIEMLNNSETSSSEVAALIMLKGDNLELFTSAGEYSKNFKTFFKYYNLQRSAKIKSFVVTLTSKVNDIIDEFNAGNLTEEQAKVAIRKTLKDSRTLATKTPKGTYQQLPTVSEFDLLFNNEGIYTEAYDGPLTLIDRVLEQQMNKGTLGLDSIGMDELYALRDATENNPKKAMTVYDRVRAELLDDNLEYLASALDSEILRDYLTSVRSGTDALIHYSEAKHPATPHTAEGLAEGLAGVTKKTADEAFGKLIEVFDPVVLAIVDKADTKFAAIKQLELMANAGDFVYNKITSKWELKKVEQVEKKSLVRSSTNRTTRTLADASKNARPEADDNIIVTADNVENLLTSFVDASTGHGRIVLSLTKSSDAVQTAWVKLNKAKNITKLKADIAEGKYTTVVQLRKLFVATAKRLELDALKKGTSKKGLEKLRVERAKKIDEIQKAKEAGASKDSISDLEIDLAVIENQLDSFKPVKTESIEKSSVSTGTLYERPDIKTSAFTGDNPQPRSQVKSLQIQRGEQLLAIDSALRKILGLSEDQRGIFTVDQRKLWSYLAKETKILTDAELAEKSMDIFGRELSESSIQRLRSSVLSEMSDLQSTLKITEEDIRIAFDANGEVNEKGILWTKLSEYANTVNTERPTKTKPVPPSRAKVTKVAKRIVETETLSDNKPVTVNKVPQKPIAENKEVVYNVTTASGEPVGPEAMTSNAADNLINATNEPTVKNAVAVDAADVVSKTDSGEVIVKPDAVKEPVGSLRVEDPKGELTVENGVATKKAVAETAQTDATPKFKVTKTKTKTVKSPTVNTEEHVDLERKINENPETLRANGMDTTFLGLFQRSYWKAMKNIDKMGSRTVITPLFRKTLTQFIAINNALHYENIAKFGEDVVAKFWSNVDRIRTEDARKSVSEPGYKRLSESKILQQAAKETHPEYMAPALLDSDLKIVNKNGEYVLEPKKAAVRAVAEKKPETYPVEEKPQASAPVKNSWSAAGLKEELISSFKTRRERLQALIDRGLVKVFGTGDNATPFVILDDRLIVVVSVNGKEIPFYISTGLGGKKAVPAGKWYPFFGITEDGWFIKLTEKEINDVYGSLELKNIKSILDDAFGNLDNEMQDLPGGTTLKEMYEIHERFYAETGLDSLRANNIATVSHLVAVLRSLNARGIRRGGGFNAVKAHIDSVLKEMREGVETKEPTVVPETKPAEATATAKPAEQASPQAEQAPPQAEQAPKPAEQSPQQAEQAPKPVEQTADAAQQTQPPKPPSRDDVIRSVIYAAANKLSIPLRHTNFIAWIFGGSNAKQRSWLQRRMSSLVNLTQGGSDLGNTVRSPYAGIRLLAGMMESSRAMTGMLVDGGQTVIKTLLSAKGDENRVIQRIINAHFKIAKFFGKDIETHRKLDRYIWTKIASGEDITARDLEVEMGLNQGAAATLKPLIDSLIDAHVRASEKHLRLAESTGLAPAVDAEGNPYDPRTWLPVQFDENGLRNVDPTRLRERLIAVRRLRKKGKVLDINTMIVLGWITVEDAARSRIDDLMLRDRTLGKEPSNLSPETMANLEVATQDGPIMYRRPKLRTDLSQSDLAKYDAAVDGDMTNYTQEWKDALNNEDLTTVEIEELIQHKLKQGRYYESRGSDRPLLKTRQRDDVSLSVPGLTPKEVLADDSGFLTTVIRTNLAEANHNFLSGRLSELIFQGELDRLFGQTGITFEEVLNTVRRTELDNINKQASTEGWSVDQKEAAIASLMSGFDRIENEYRSHVETLPYNKKPKFASIANGALVIARIGSALSWGLKSMAEPTLLHMREPLKEWPKNLFTFFNYLVGERRTSKTNLLDSPAGDLFSVIQHIRYKAQSRFGSSDVASAAEMDSTLNLTDGGSRWNNTPMRIFEKMSKLSNIIGSLESVTNFTKEIAKKQVQRRIFHAIKKGHIQSLLDARKIPEIKAAMDEYLKAASESAAGERKLWKVFAGLARKHGFGQKPQDALFFLFNGLDSVEKINHLKWALDKVADETGRADLIDLMTLAEDVRRNPVEGINPDILDDVVSKYNIGIDAEISRKHSPEPWGLNRIVEPGNALSQFIYALTGWMRGFQDGRIVDYASNSGAGYLGFLMAYGVIESLYQMLREWIAGRDVSDIALEIRDNPASFISRLVYAVPFLGAGNSILENAVGLFTGGSVFKPSTMSVDVATPGISVALSIPSRTSRALNKSYQAFSKGQVAEGFGNLGDIPLLPVNPLLNQSPLAVPVRILEEVADLDEKNAVQRYLTAAHKDAAPYSAKNHIKIGKKADVMYGSSYDNRIQQLQYAERIRQQQEEEKKAAESMVVPKPVGPLNASLKKDTRGVSAPLADLLGQQQ